MISFETTNSNLQVVTFENIVAVNNSHMFSRVKRIATRLATISLRLRTQESQNAIWRSGNGRPIFHGGQDRSTSANIGTIGRPGWIEVPLLPLTRFRSSCPCAHSTAVLLSCVLLPLVPDELDVAALRPSLGGGHLHAAIGAAPPLLILINGFADNRSLVGVCFFCLPSVYPRCYPATPLPEPSGRLCLLEDRARPFPGQAKSDY